MGRVRPKAPRRKGPRCDQNTASWIAAIAQQEYLGSMKEIELKFLLTEEQADALDALLPTLQGLHARPETRQLRSAYHDTESGALRGAGIALRLRHDGLGCVQTAKGAISHHGGIQTTLESETPRPDGALDVAAIPHDGLREQVQALTAGAPLAARVETEMRRHSATVSLPGGGAAEIAVDRGTLRGGGRSAPLTELEIELKGGTVPAVYDLARQILPEGGLRLSRRSKAARAFALADGHDAVDRPALRKANPVPLQAHQTAESAARDVLRECFDQIARNADFVQVSDAPEGPHQLRIGLRRLRAAFDVFGVVLDGPACAHLKAEARWLAHEAGAVRDLDVTVQDLLAPEATAHPMEPGFQRLAAHLTARADAQRLSLRGALTGARAQAFLLDLARFTEARGWLDLADFGQSAQLAQPLSAIATAALDRHWKRAAKRARGIDHLDIEARHDLRKALKGLRYAVEFLAPVLPAGATKTFTKRLRTLQDLFGELNDLAMAQEMLTGADAPGGDDPQAQRAVGWILGSRSVRAEADWAGARKLWHALRDAPRPWDTPG
ncbi:inorganic triphosphatase [Meridianimarinicoccus roseus]|uniref:Inorganic triphosphatase n=2 Tax=Meridianimarinicoccus roseus TaxID=2072018 RepID=A0A2V2LIR7_9RHOB|nr:inorganic triphosphatase [Meridianimarinicoccus roseus]